MTVTQIDSIPQLESPVENHDSLLRGKNSAKTGVIMIVDDEPINIKVVQKHLKSAGYTKFVTTSDSRDALDMIRREKPDVVVLDIMMPHVTGINILEVIRGDRMMAHLPVLILSAAAEEDTKSYALELGATDFLSKPVKPTELIPRVKNALLVKTHHDQMAAYSKRLEDEVRQRTSELVQSRQDVIHVLACAAEYRDQQTGNHVLRVGRYAGIIAQRLGFNSARTDLIEQAAILHDVGKIGIPDAILLKPGQLTDDEMKQMRVHCEYGINILHGIPSDGNKKFTRNAAAEHLARSPMLSVASRVAVSHHEKWNGSGYPLGIAGEAIPIEGRITAVADVFDALGSRRPYKEAMPLDRCCEILEEGRGTHFDPKILDAFFAGIDEIVKASIELAD